VQQHLLGYIKPIHFLKVLMNMMLVRSAVVISAAIAASAVTVAPAFAGSISYTGNTTGQPTWTRPQSGTPPTLLSLVGTNTPFSVFGFQVDVGGSYDFTSIGTNPADPVFDVYLHLYQNAFDPASQLANLLVGDDDGGLGEWGAAFSQGLSANTSYFLVTSGYDNSDIGEFNNSITGPGNIAAVPTPALLPGVLGFGMSILRKKKRGDEAQAV
jgi:hypothetical protein